MKNLTPFEKYRALFIVFFKTALFTVGGGYAMLPVIEEEIVKKKKWLEHKDIIDILAIVQSVPGIITLNAGVFIGYKLAGFRGAFAAALGVLMPSFFIILLIAMLFGFIKKTIWIDNAFLGVRAGVTALILLAAMKLGKSVLKGKFEWIITICAFLGAAVFKINIIYLIATGAFIGIIYHTFKEDKISFKLRPKK